MKKLIGVICGIIVVCIGIYVVTSPKTITLDFDPDYYTPEDLEDANENADYIIRGNFTSYEKDWNMLRDDHDLSLENEYGVITGKIYQFHISEVFKGNIESNNVSINLQYSTRLYFNDDGQLNYDELKGIKNVQYIDYIEAIYIEPDFAQDYILYVNYDEYFDLYYAAFYPFMVEINDDQLKFVQTDLSDHISEYHVDDVEVIVNEEYNEEIYFINSMSLTEFKQNLIVEIDSYKLIYDWNKTLKWNKKIRTI